MKTLIFLNTASRIRAGLHKKHALDATEINTPQYAPLGTHLLDAPTEGSEDPRVLLHIIIIRDATNKYFRAASNLCKSPLKET